jgi:sugar lactone lactonase YvrE
VRGADVPRADEMIIPAPAEPADLKVFDLRTRLGESPVWDAASGRLFFVDIPAQRLHALDPASGRVEGWPMPEKIGSIALCRDGRILVALKSSVQLFAPATGRLERFAVVEEDRPHNRLNDGKAAPDGSFWVGSMDDRPEKEASGALYRVAPDGRVERKFADVLISNGIAFSADGRRLWFSDSRGRWIRCWDHEPGSGRLSNERVVAADIAETTGRPDGAATDAAGGYWSAGVSAGVLNRWTADGAIERRVRVPMPNPTMPCFAGADLRTVFVTSLVREPHPLAGALCSLRLDVAGVPVAHFAV